MNQLTSFSTVSLIKRTGYFDVVIYYSFNGEKFRPPTGVKIDPKYVLKSGKISGNYPHPENFDTINKVHEKVESLIKGYWEKYSEKPPVSWLKKEYEKKHEDGKKDLKEVFSCWDEFIVEKETVSRSEATINHYTNLKQNLDSFSSCKNYALTFANLDQQFFNDLLSYLINEHEHGNSRKDEETGKKPDIGLSNDTAIKRLKCFVEYLKYCTIEFDVPINLEKIKKYIKLARHKQEVRPLGKSQKWELTLTVDEIEFVVNLDYHAPEYWNSLSDNQKRFLDIFVFMCLQGTAPVDTKEIGRTDIRAGKIIKDRSKTGNEFNVELDPISEDILERNDYNLNFTEQNMNDELKRLFVTIFELFREHHAKRSDVPYQMVCMQKTKKGNVDVMRIQHRGLFVELMTGRRSFITNIGEGQDEKGIKETMTKVGHTKIETTLGYMHHRQQAKRNKGGLFGITKLKD